MMEKIGIFSRHSRKFLGYMLSKENNLRRGYNLLKAIINWKILKRIKLKTYPVSLTICPGDICNLSCELCPVGLKQEGRKKGFMKFENFKKIIDELGEYLYEVYLYNWGEPLLNKEIFKMIRYAKRYNIKVTISSNLMVFDGSISKELIDSGLDVLVVSLHGASNDSISRYQRGGNFKKAYSNMKNLIRIRESFKKKKPLIQWKFIVNRHNESEIENAKKLFKESGVDEISFEDMLPNMGTYVLRSEEECFKELLQWNPKNDEYSIFDYKTKKKKFHTSSCNWLWLMSAINWDGSVSPCCSIWFEKFDFGNCLKSSFMDVWNNENYQNARKIILEQKINKFNICEVCKKNTAQI